MKKRLILDALALLVLALALCGCLCLTGCAQTRGAPQDVSASPDTVSVQPAPTPVETETDENYRWITQKDSFYPFESGYSVNYVARLGATLMITGVKDSVNNALAFVQYSVNETEGIALSAQSVIQFENSNDNRERVIYGAASGNDGFFYVLAGNYPKNLYDAAGDKVLNESFSGEYSILKYDVTGSLISRMQFEYDSPTNEDFRGLAVIDQENIAVYSSEDYLLLGWTDGMRYAANDEELQIFALQQANDSIIGGVAYNGMSNHGFNIIRIDADVTYSFINNFGSITPCQALGNEYLFNDGEMFFCYDFETNERTDEFRWNYGTQLASCTMACRLGADAYAYTSIGSDMLYLVCRVAVPARENQSVVKVALFNTDTAGGDAEELNNTASEYLYECTAYTEADIDRLLTEIAAGSGPDLILFNGEIDTSSKFFEDLYPYIDNDPDISRDSFIPNLLKSLEINGQVHELWTGAQISTLAAREADVGGKDKLTIPDYFELLNANDNYTAFFQSFMTGTNLLSWIANISAGEYIDWESGTCNFTDPSFAELLSWCKYMAPEYEGEQAAVYYDISEVILSVESFYDVGRLEVIQRNFGAPYVFVGFPCNSGYGHYYSCAYGCAAAIPVTSANKDGAWHFIKNQLLERKQVDSYPLDGMPVNMAALSRVSAEFKDERLKNQFYELLSQTTKSICYGDNQLRKLIVESGQGYLAGDKSLEETVNLIQSRVSIYVAEQYG